MASYVEAHLQFELREPADLLVQIAVAAGTPVRSESCQFSREGDVYVPREIVGRHGTRVMRVQAGAGIHRIGYAASVAGSRAIDAVDEFDLIEYRRPSRYVESDELRGQALSEFAGLRGFGLVDAVGQWTASALRYVPGSSSGTSSARAALEAGIGVCRDYAHVAVAMLRASDVPARVASVYAPGLEPMDFHAVAEAWVDGGWVVIDPTGRAPRQSFVRIATGRDASDVAFIAAHPGNLSLRSVRVEARSDTTVEAEKRRPVALA